MLAADSSTLIAYFNGETTPDVEIIIEAAKARGLFLPPVVLTEILSTPEHAKVWGYIESIPILPVKAGYWERVASIRRVLLAKKLKSRLADAMVCQSCLDADLPLVTRDKDFRHYEKIAGLRLIKKLTGAPGIYGVSGLSTYSSSNDS